MNKKLIALVALISCTSTMVSAVSYQMMGGMAGLFGLATAGIVKRYKTVARRQVKQLIEDVKQIADLPMNIEQVSENLSSRESGCKPQFLKKRLDYYFLRPSLVEAANGYLLALKRGQAMQHKPQDRQLNTRYLKERKEEFNEQLKSYGMTETF